MSFLHRRQHRRVARVEALRVAEAPFARAVGDIKNDVVGAGLVARDAADPQQMIKPEYCTHAPGDVVVCARRVAADTDAAEQFLACAIKAESAAEDVDAAETSSG